MKKILTAIAVTLLFGASVFAEGYISANDLELGTVDSPRKEEDGFVLNATNAEKQFLVIEDKSKDPVTCDGEKIINRINFKGGGKKDYRSISFPAKAGETVKIYCASAKT